MARGRRLLFVYRSQMQMRLWLNRNETKNDVHDRR
jgi:hypothetical protein